MEEGSSIAEDVRLFDFQLHRYCSPAVDLIDFIFTTSDKELRAKHYHSLIRLYYDQLALNIRLLGSDPAKIFTFEDLQSDLI